jgi:putative Mg2+ transporter-C (MgtC) family protein
MTEVSLRLLAAFAAGALVGWEREVRGRPAGLRTTILACLAAAIAMIISETYYAESATLAAAGAWRPDPARLAAGILTGIGFLGAGTILRHENFVRGVTTAASLWIVTVLGLALGGGMFLVGATGLALTVATLMLLPKVERIMPTDWYVTLKITVSNAGPTEQALMELVQARGLRILSMKLHWEAEQQCRSLELDLKCKRQERFTMSAQIVAELSLIEGVVRVHWD